MKNKWMYRLGLALFPIFVAGIILCHVGLFNLTSLLYPCLFYRLSRLYCPGCGGTRAVQALLHGNLLSSFFYHPFVLYCAVLYAWFMLSHTIERICQKKSPHKKPIVRGLDFRLTYVYFGVLLILIQWIVKNLSLLFGNH